MTPLQMFLQMISSVYEAVQFDYIPSAELKDSMQFKSWQWEKKQHNLQPTVKI